MRCVANETFVNWFTSRCDWDTPFIIDDNGSVIIDDFNVPDDFDEFIQDDELTDFFINVSLVDPEEVPTTSRVEISKVTKIKVNINGEFTKDELAGILIKIQTAIEEC